MLVAEQTGVKPLRARRCWVVGCGLLGRHLLAEARTQGMRALGIDRSAAADVQGDAADPAVLAAARARLEPEFIFCCAATRGGDEAAYRATYVELPRALQAACPQARLVLCSSTSVYGAQGGAVLAEDSPCQADSPRARVLLEAEAAVLGSGGIVARLTPLYADSRCELLRGFLQREPELPGEDSRWLNYLHVEDAARALLCLAACAANEGAPHLLNVCGESFTKGAVYAALSRFSGMPRVEAARSGGRRGVSDGRVSAALLRSLGWQPQVEFVAWASAQGYKMF